MVCIACDSVLQPYGRPAPLWEEKSIHNRGKATETTETKRQGTRNKEQNINDVNVDPSCTSIYK